MSRKTPESYVKAAILDYLAATGVYAQRLNSGVQMATYKGKQRMIRMAAPGTADILALYPCHDCNRGFLPVWIEAKAEKGRQSEAQKSFEEDVLRRGHQYVIARSVDDVADFLQNL